MEPATVDERDLEAEIAILTAIVLDVLGPALARYRVQVGRRLDLDAPSLACLEMLRRPGAVTGAVISETTGLTSSAVSKMLDRLETAGHVERDGRAPRRGGRGHVAAASGAGRRAGSAAGGDGPREARRHVDRASEDRRARRRERDRPDRW